MNLMGQPLRVGQHVHSAEHRVSQRTIDFYTETFGDSHPYYTSEGSGPMAGPIAPPLLYHSEVYAHPERWYLKNLVGNLHATQEWMLYEPLRPGMQLRTRSTLTDRYLKRNREVLVNEVDYQDEKGRLLVRGRTYQSFLAQGRSIGEGFVVDRGSARSKQARPVAAAEGPEIEPLRVPVDATLCWRFSGPGRNYHTDAEEARKLGFPDIVVQGMLSTCLISQIMGSAFNQGWFCGGRMSVKLVNVLWAGETVVVRGRLREDLPEGTQRRQLLDVWVEKADAQRTVVTVGTASALY